MLGPGECRPMDPLLDTGCSRSGVLTSALFPREVSDGAELGTLRHAFCATAFNGAAIL